MCFRGESRLLRRFSGPPEIIHLEIAGSFLTHPRARRSAGLHLLRLEHRAGQRHFEGSAPWPHLAEQSGGRGVGHVYVMRDTPASSVEPEEVMATAALRARRSANRARLAALQQERKERRPRDTTPDS